jgi:hypothetical protein
MTDGNDSATAFSFEEEIGDYGFKAQRVQYGLSKREHFAAMAMQGLMANPASLILNLNDPSKAEYSVIMADKLIAELNKETTT